MAVGLIIDPKTGEILAMTSRPNFDPNNPGDSKPEQMKNRAIIDQVEPGSTFKIVVASAALTEGKVSENTGIYCEGGKFAYGGHILALARDHDIGIAACVMTGNEADISLGEVIAVLVEDEHTDVIAVYSEGIRDGTRFVAALDAARRARKPVVMMKVGTSRVGSAAAQSHTASIAGDDGDPSIAREAAAALGKKAIAFAGSVAQAFQPNLT